MFYAQLFLLDWSCVLWARFGVCLVVFQWLCTSSGLFISCIWTIADKSDINITSNTRFLDVSQQLYSWRTPHRVSLTRQDLNSLNDFAQMFHFFHFGTAKDSLIALKFNLQSVSMIQMGGDVNWQNMPATYVIPDLWWQLLIPHLS